MPHKTRVIWNKIKTICVVVVITFLIWFAADQNVMEPESFTISVRLASTDPDRYVSLAEAPYQVTLRVTVRGRRRHRQDFAELLKSQSVFVANIDESKPTSKTPQSISVIDDVLSTIRPIQESRLAIASVEPMTLSALIDEYVHVTDVHVKPDYGDLRVSAELSPQHVSVLLECGRPILADSSCHMPETVLLLTTAILHSYVNDTSGLRLLSTFCNAG